MQDTRWLLEQVEQAQATDMYGEIVVTFQGGLLQHIGVKRTLRNPRGNDFLPRTE